MFGRQKEGGGRLFRGSGILGGDGWLLGLGNGELERSASCLCSVGSWGRRGRQQAGDSCSGAATVAVTWVVVLVVVVVVVIAAAAVRVGRAWPGRVRVCSVPAYPGCVR